MTKVVFGCGVGVVAGIYLFVSVYKPYFDVYTTGQIVLACIRAIIPETFLCGIYGLIIGFVVSLFVNYINGNLSKEVIEVVTNHLKEGASSQNNSSVLDSYFSEEKRNEDQFVMAKEFMKMHLCI